MSARLLVIALDAAEVTLIERWAASGELPHFKMLMEHGTTFDVDSPMTTLPGSIWPEITTGISAGRIPHYYHPAQLRSGEATRRPITSADVDPEHYFWVIAGRAGRRIACLDLPHTLPASGLDGVQLFEWGLHDYPSFGTCSEPDTFLFNVRAQFGNYPLHDCEAQHVAAQDYATQLAELKRGLDLKSALFEQTLCAQDFDLFTCCYQEPHCAGHQFWHFHDTAHPRHKAEDPAELKNAMRDIYREIDAALGRLIAAAGPDAQVMVMTNNGITRFTGGANILPEFLARLGLASSEDGKTGQIARQLQRGANPFAKFVRRVARPLLGEHMLRKVQARLGALREPLADPATKAAALFNNRIGAIRLNVRGREPHGTIAPGNEYGALLEDIRGALHELQDPVSGAPIVAQTLSAQEAYGANHHPDVPDLMVTFRTDLGEIWQCASPRVGHIRAKFDPSLAHRSGDHTAHARIWLKSARAAPGVTQKRGHLLDLTPTILDLLGVPIPQGLDGRSLLGP